jgi:hypothetical protein
MSIYDINVHPREVTLESIKKAGGSCEMEQGGVLHTGAGKGESAALMSKGQSSDWLTVRALSCACDFEISNGGVPGRGFRF